MNVKWLHRLDETIRIVTVFLLPPWFANLLNWTMMGRIHWIFLALWAITIIGGFIVRYRIIKPKIRNKTLYYDPAGIA